MRRPRGSRRLRAEEEARIDSGIVEARYGSRGYIFAPVFAPTDGWDPATGTTDRPSARRQRHLAPVLGTLSSTRPTMQTSMVKSSIPTSEPGT